MQSLKNLWNKFYYSYPYQVVWEWWEYSGGRRLFFTGVLVACLCGIVFALQEIRINQIKQTARQEKANLQDDYNRRIFVLQIELAQEKHNNLPPEERKRREELLQFFKNQDEWEREQRRNSLRSGK